MMEDYGPESYGVTTDTGKSMQRGSAPYGLQTQMWKALRKASDAMSGAGLGRPGVNSGYRSAGEQESLYKKQPDKTARKGKSVHGLGLAVDLRITGEQYRWLLKNADRYGLVNLPSEPHHWQLSPERWMRYTG